MVRAKRSPRTRIVALWVLAAGLSACGGEASDDGDDSPGNTQGGVAGDANDAAASGGAAGGSGNASSDLGSTMTDDGAGAAGGGNAVPGNADTGNETAGGDPAAMAGDEGDGGDALPELMASPDPIPVDCQGFELEGIKYSPGGTDLPNRCAPFHPTWNNPYAVLCVHAWPWYETRFPGDQYCILPPPEDKGVQVGFHPMEGDYWEQVSSGDMSGYETSDPEWVLPAGGENTRNYVAPAGTSEPQTYYRTYFRMRTGSHHNIITLHDPNPEFAWLPSLGDSLPGLFDPARPVQSVLGGQQRPDDSTPQTLDKPPEDAGLYLNWPSDPSVLYNLHFFNSTDGDALKEGWVNIWWEDDTVTAANWYMGLAFEQLASLSMAPGEVEDYHYSWNIAEPVRLLRVFGHRHAWTSNFSSWIERANGDTELIYQSYDWYDMPTYRYDSVTTNPPLDPAQRLDGAVSGIVELNAGDSMHFNCHIEFTQERAATENAPDPASIGTLRFANEVYAGEMCIQFGNVAGARIGSPTRNTAPVPEFAK